MRDDLGDRMKQHYENRTRCFLPRRTFTVIRVDGKAFHTFTHSLDRPFDAGLMEDMDKTATALCAEIAGSAFAFIQSDEISLLLTDFDSPGTEAWFDGNLQKIVSISASIATAAFNRARLERRVLEAKALFAGQEIAPELLLETPPAHFDSRAFTIPDPTEVENYFLWRQQDASRNSISMAAQSVCSHHELQGKSSDELQEILWQHGINWNDYPEGFKRGRIVVKKARRETVTFTHRKTGEQETVEAERHFWEAEAPPVFTRDRAYLAALIPRYT
jgi:tRNA(His) 5'-end guanylyltransferase